VAARIAAGLACHASQTLDRVVASVGNVAITATDVVQEYRFERFLDAQWPPPPPTAGQLADVRERLTYQMLLTREENLGPDDQAASQQPAAARAAALRKAYLGPEGYERAMKELGLTEAQVLARIKQQELMLRLIDQRLRPAALPGEDEVNDYYRSTFVPEFQKKNGGASVPAFAEVEREIQEVLTQKHINDLLGQWIDELKPATNVRFHSF